MAGNKQIRIQQGWRALMADLGISPAPVLKLAGLPEDLFRK